MKHVRQKQSRIGIALFTSCMLVFQALVTAFAMGPAQAVPVLDAFGNPLCITGTEAPAHNRADHAVPADCCTVSCSMFASVFADDRTPHSLFNPLSASVPRESLAAEPILRAFVSERWLGSPRAPPPLA